MTTPTPDADQLLADQLLATQLIPAQAGPSEPLTPAVRPLTLGGVADLPRVNLLPPEIQQARRLRRIKGLLVAGVASSVVLVVLATLSAGGAVDEAGGVLATEQARGQALDREVIKLGDVSATYARVRADQEMLASAMGREVRWSRYLNDLSLTVPDGIWVTQLTVTQEEGVAAATAPAPATAPAAPVPAPAAAPAPAAVPGTAPGNPVAAASPGLGQVVVTGMAADHDAVAAWLESLAGQQGYTAPYFSAADEAKVGTKEFVRFTSTVTVTADALSGCYTLERTGC